MLTTRPAGRCRLPGPNRVLASAAAALLVGACAAAPPVPGPVVAVEASEFSFAPASVSVPAGAVSFHVTNTGSLEHEFEILQGERVLGEVEGLVPGLEMNLTVELPTGEYEFVCRLPGHLEAGMRGTLTVTR